MNTKKTNSILKEVLSEAKPNKNEIKEIANRFKDFKVKLLEKIKKLKVHVEIFVGGSFAKKTLIRKKEYDVDVFLRFDKRHRKEISELTEKILNGFNKTKIHGSRDYFMIKLGKNIIFEVIPVLKIKNPKEAENITDLSYFHVNYVRKKVNPKVIDEIIKANPGQLAEYRSGKDKLFGFFVGQVMKESKGKANPAKVNELLKKKLQ